MQLEYCLREPLTKLKYFLLQLYKREHFVLHIWDIYTVHSYYTYYRTYNTYISGGGRAVRVHTKGVPLTGLSVGIEVFTYRSEYGHDDKKQ